MNFKSLIANRKLIPLIFFVIIFILTGLLEPWLKSNTQNNWDKILIDNLENYEERIISILNNKYDLLLDMNKELKEKISRVTLKNDLSKCFDLINEYRFYTIEIYNDEKKLICWNNEPVFDINKHEFDKEDLSQTFFYKRKLITYLSIIDTVQWGSEYYFIISMAVEKNYKLLNENFTNLSLTDSLSSLLTTFVEIDYDSKAELSKDGRKHSFPILNNFKNKIGIATIDKPSVDTELKTISNNIESLQHILFLLILINLIFLLNPFIQRINNKLIKFLLFALLMIFIRVLLFLFNIPSKYLTNSLTDAANFSSVFAFGIVRSPLEFFITLVFILLIVWIGFIYFIKYNLSSTKNYNTWLRYLILIFGTLIILLIYRGLGASIRSVVFDSTIRYFKEFNVFPSSQILLMNINILILGFICLLLAVMIMIWIYNTFKLNEKGLLPILLIILFTQITGWLFDYFQKQPQGTPLIRIIFLIVIILLVYYFLKKKIKLIFYIYTAIASSIIAIGLLSYYNSEIERESLKTTAYEITNTDIDIYKFILFQTLVNSQYDQNIINSFNDNNYSPALFSYWTKSLIYKENIPINISLYNIEGKLLGYFSTNGEVDSIDYNIIKKTITPTINVINSVYSSKQKFIGITPIYINGKLNGYLTCTTIINIDEPIIRQLPNFLASSRAGISSATDLEKLKIFYLVDNKIVNSFGTVGLNQNEYEVFKSVQYNKHNEAWLESSINREEHIIYVLKYGSEGNKSVAVALEMSAIALRLSNFFKIFFIHSILIFISLLIYSLRFIKKWKHYFSLYRTKLTFALIVVSVIPLIVIAVYFRNISDAANRKTTNDRLTSYALQLESYFKKYLTSTSVSAITIYQKASVDLGIKFNIYYYKDLVYSTDNNYYQVGLLDKIINPIVYQRCVINGSEKTFIEENIDRNKYYSVYKSSILSNTPILIHVNDLFNRSSSISDDEPALFLFGIISLVLIILIVLSTFLARQISSPINKLTLATKSVGSGDLNIELKVKSSGEIADLILGFNKMVEQIKRSQIELAQLERETAWKEMAKQVAHEIKNPLTPMKLSVQQLIASYNDKSKKFDEIFNKVTTTLLTQIEILKNIATEFSYFARMPKLNIEKINLSNIILNAISLFIDEQQKIKFISPDKNVFVNADSDQMSRTIINLIRNSIQAEADDITIELNIENSSALIRIYDNGTGINYDNLNKVFEENFTTKLKGMGIGLSMAKKFIEAIDGTIMIENTSPNGTTILIKLPLVDL